MSKKSRDDGLTKEELEILAILRQTFATALETFKATVRPDDKK